MLKVKSRELLREKSAYILEGRLFGFPIRIKSIQRIEEIRIGYIVHKYGIEFLCEFIEAKKK